MGQEWTIKHLNPEMGGRGFLQLKSLDVSHLQIQSFRAIDLGELLFNLQHIENFDSCLSRLKGGDVESALAELDIARMLYKTSQWIEGPNFIGDLAKLTNDFFRTTGRIVSAKYYAAPLFYDGGRIGQGHRFIEFNSTKHRFGNFHQWDLLTHWRPRSGHWNLLPKKWVRLVFFPHNDSHYEPGFRHEQAQ
jgi:hypothetical protein